MPFEPPFPPAIFAGTIDAVQHEHGGVTPGPGADLDLIDAVNLGHIIPLTPGISPVSYFVHFDILAGTVTAPPQVASTD